MTDLRRGRRPRWTTATLAALAVDMPIGLPDDGPRLADQQARRRLGARRSSVFPTPVRATLDAVDYPDALAISRRVSGKGLSKQAFNLLPRIGGGRPGHDPGASRTASSSATPSWPSPSWPARPCATPSTPAAGIDERVALLIRRAGSRARSADAGRGGGRPGPGRGSRRRGRRRGHRPGGRRAWPPATATSSTWATAPATGEACGWRS